MELSPEFLKQIELRTLRAKRSYLGARQGTHRSPRKGQGLEFSDFRPYQPGDSPRDIDWGVYGRTDKLYVKQFHEEEALSVVIIIDTTSSMAVEPQKWSRALEIAAGLTYVGLLNQESVVVTAGSWFQSPILSGGKAFRGLLSALPSTPPQHDVDLSGIVRRGVNRIRLPGIGIFITDYLYPVTEAAEMLHYFRAKNLETYSLRLLTPAEATGEYDYHASLIDSESGERRALSWSEKEKLSYRENFLAHAEHLESICREQGVTHVTHRTDQSLLNFFTDVLPVTGLLR